MTKTVRLDGQAWLGLALLTAVIAAASVNACSPEAEESARAETAVAEATPSELRGVTQEALPSRASPFFSFSEEAARATAALACSEAHITPGEHSAVGPLYGCIQGAAQTAKYWINGSAIDAEAVENLKVMWNRWTRNIGAGAVNADEAEARTMVSAALRLYQIDNPEQIMAWFVSHEVGERSFQDDRFRVRVEKSQGPAINEHLLVIEAL